MSETVSSLFISILNYFVCFLFCRIVQTLRIVVRGNRVCLSCLQMSNRCMITSSMRTCRYAVEMLKQCSQYIVYGLTSVPTRHRYYNFSASMNIFLQTCFMMYIKHYTLTDLGFPQESYIMLKYLKLHHFIFCLIIKTKIFNL